MKAIGIFTLCGLLLSACGGSPAEAQDTIGPQPDGESISCDKYWYDTAQRIDSSCIGFGMPSMRNWKVLWGESCLKIVYRGGREISRERLSGQRVISESPGECSTD